MAAEDGSRRLRWGFMSTASIASKNYLAIKSASKTCEIVAVASRSLEKAKAWAAERGEAALHCYGSYEELLADPGVDAVYMPLPTSMHLEWAVKAASAKKHILIEKPVALDAAQYRSIIDACLANNVVIMDGTMFSHHERLKRITDVIKSGELGELRRLESGFSFCADEDWLKSNIRTSASLDPLGALGDLSWYQVRFALHAFDGEMPTHVSAICHASTADGTPIDISATLFYGSGAGSNAHARKTVTFDASFLTSFRQFVHLAGTKGQLSLDDFVICRSAEECAFSVVTEPGLADSHRRVTEGLKRTVTVYGCNQEARMFEDFAALVFTRDAAEERRWRELSLKTQAVLDACLTSMRAAGPEAPGPKVPVATPEII